MKAPGDYRPGIWRGRVLQIKVGNFCDLDCSNCSVGVGIAKNLKRIFMMTPEQFRAACRSLAGFPGVIGMFGGNPCIHPKFEELCEIFREEIPNKDQRGLWSNNLRGHGEICRETFSPEHSNLNVHGVRDAWDEIRRVWPEAKPIPAGLNAVSHHGPIFGSMLDLGVSEKEMWERVSKCYVNQTWSAEITVVAGQLQGYFCEVAATMAELENDPSRGTLIVPGWWNKPIDTFKEQVNHFCSKCLIAMNPKKVPDDQSVPEQYTATWHPVMVNIKRRNMQQVTTLEEIAGDDSPATKYLPRGVMPAGVK